MEEDKRHILAKMMGCHGLPERCFVIKGKRMPICARCTGLLVGYVIFAPIPLFLRPSLLYIPFGLILVSPLLIDGITQAMGKRASNNLLRLITGILGGIGQIMIMFIMTTLFIKLFLFLLSLTGLQINQNFLSI